MHASTPLHTQLTFIVCTWGAQREITVCMWVHSWFLPQALICRFIQSFVFHDWMVCSTNCTCPNKLNLCCLGPQPFFVGFNTNWYYLDSFWVDQYIMVQNWPTLRPLQSCRAASILYGYMVKVHSPCYCSGLELQSKELKKSTIFRDFINIS